MSLRTVLLLVAIVAVCFSMPIREEAPADPPSDEGSANLTFSLTYNWNSHYSWNFEFNAETYWQEVKGSVEQVVQLSNFKHLPSLHYTVYNFCDTNGYAYGDFQYTIFDTCSPLPCENNPKANNYSDGCGEYSLVGDGPTVNGHPTQLFRANCSWMKDFGYVQVTVGSQGSTKNLPFELDLVVYSRIYVYTTNVTFSITFRDYETNVNSSVFDVPQRCNAPGAEQSQLNAALEQAALDTDVEDEAMLKKMFDTSAPQQMPASRPSPSILNAPHHVAYAVDVIRQVKKFRID